MPDDKQDDKHETECSIVLSEVYLYLDLECSETRRALIRTHLEECSRCLAEYGLEHEVKALVARSCGDERAPTELRERLRIRLSEMVVEVETREYLPD